MSTHLPEAPIPGSKSKGTGGPTNWLATLVLVPSVPMLLLSIAALAMFYIAPVRFGSLLAKLPGETFLRTALVFAPATLFAVVVLAFLYAIDSGKVEAGEKERPVSAPSRGRLTAWVMLAPSAPALFLSTALWGLSFVSPTRLERLIEPLPGTSYIRKLIPFMPPMLFLLVFLLLIYLFLVRSDDEAVVEKPGGGINRFTNVMVFGTLIVALTALAFTAVALGAYYFKPDTFASIVARIPFDEFVRSTMMFAPAVLFALVVLAILFLKKPARVYEDQGEANEASAAGVQVREQAATLVLIAGLSFSAVAAIGIVGTILYLLVR